MAKLPDVSTLGAASAQAELLKLRVRYPGYTDYELLLHALALKHERITELEDTIDGLRAVACDMASRWACAIG